MKLLIDIMHGIMQNVKKCTGLHISVAVLNIGHCV